MSATKQKIWTYNDYSKLDDDKRYEIIEGELTEMSPSPREIHRAISINLGTIINIHVKENQLGKIYAAPFDLILDNKNVVQPDLMFISKERKKIITDGGIFGSPDLLIEILSPSTSKRDREVKFRLYEKFQVAEYWIIDPVKSKIEIYNLEDEKYRLSCSVQNNETVQSIVLSSVSVTYNNLVE